MTTIAELPPGFVDTAMLEPYVAYRPGIEARIPSGRFAQPHEIATFLHQMEEWRRDCDWKHAARSRWAAAHRRYRRASAIQ